MTLCITLYFSSFIQKFHHSFPILLEPKSYEKKVQAEQSRYFVTEYKIVTGYKTGD